MIGISIRVDEKTHHQLKCVLLYRGSTIQDFIIELLKREIEHEAGDILRNDTTGDAARLFERVGFLTKL